jgi:Guanine nucleotide exchange factor synembryn
MWMLACRDRTKPLEEREDLLGRCIRLMSCVYFSRVKDTVGELLFTICDSDGEFVI